MRNFIETFERYKKLEFLGCRFCYDEVLKKFVILDMSQVDFLNKCYKGCNVKVIVIV